MELQQTKFDYSIIDTETASYLKQKEVDLRGIASKVYSDMGKGLMDARERLAKRGYGCFCEWVESIGISTDSAYNYINYHKLLSEQFEKRELLELLPKKLVYEAAKPSAPDDLRQKVLSGNITTVKEYQAEVKARKAAEAKAKELERQLVEAQNREPEVIEKQVEVIPHDVQQKLSEAKILKQQYNELATENKRLKFEVEANKNPVDGHLEMEAKVSTFTGRVKNFLRDMAPLGYLGQEVLKSSPGAQKEYESAIMALEKWCSDMRDVMVKPTKEKIIEVEVL